MSILQILADEISADPLVRGYSGMTDQQVTDDINTAYRTRPVGLVATEDIYEAIVPAEYALISASDKEDLAQLYRAHSSSGVPLGGTAQNVLVGIFGAGSTSRDQLIALATEPITRGVEINAGAPHKGDIRFARTM